jgi:peroxiredoxin
MMESADTQAEPETVEAREATATRLGRWRDASRSRAGTLLIMGVTAVVILAVVYAVNRSGASGGGLQAVALSGVASGPAPIVDKPAPDFTATTFDGETVTLSELKGRPVWLTFGASWCQPCRAENPDIQAIYDKYRAKGLVVLAVFISEPESDARAYAKRVGLTYPKIADPDSRIAVDYRIVGIPSHFFIDRAGVLRILRIGTLDPEGMEAAVGEISG